MGTVGNFRMLKRQILTFQTVLERQTYINFAHCHRTELWIPEQTSFVSIKLDSEVRCLDLVLGIRFVPPRSATNNRRTMF